MKFKVGDKVRIRGNLEIGKKYGDMTLLDTMAKYRGREGTITNLCDEDYEIDADESGYSWSEEALEGVNEPENVNHPSHYNQGKYEVIDVINDWKMNFNLGNAIKYIARCDYKGKPVEDLQKAIFYLNDEIKRRENKDE